MSPKHLTPEYFDDRSEAAKIEIALLNAIPDESHYSALVMALTSLLAHIAQNWVEENCKQRWYKKP